MPVFKTENHSSIAVGTPQSGAKSKVGPRLPAMLRALKNKAATPSTSTKMNQDVANAQKFINKLNAYIEGQQEHLEKLRVNIDQSTAISNLIKLVENNGKDRVEWVGTQASKEELNKMLSALKDLHGQLRSSFYHKIKDIKFLSADQIQLSGGSNAPSSLNDSIPYNAELNSFVDHPKIELGASASTSEGVPTEVEDVPPSQADTSQTPDVAKSLTLSSFGTGNPWKNPKDEIPTPESSTPTPAGTPQSPGVAESSTHQSTNPFGEPQEGDTTPESSILTKDAPSSSSSSTSAKFSPESQNAKNAKHIIDKLNDYIKEKPGHLEKLEKDIRECSKISSLITVQDKNGEKTVEWKVKEATNKDLNKMLAAFKSRHGFFSSPLLQQIKEIQFLDAAPVQQSGRSEVPSSLSESPPPVKGNKPFEEKDKLNAIVGRSSANTQQPSTSTGTVALPVKPSSEPLPDGLAITVLQMLNQYLRFDGKHQDSQNKSHIKKITEDINQIPALGKYIQIEQGGKEVKVIWGSKRPETTEQLQELWDAFNSRHDLGKGSFGELFANFSLSDAGVRVLSEQAHAKLIANAAAPNPHALGKRVVVEMKLKTATKILEFYEKSENQNQKMPDEDLLTLVAHYGREDQEISAAQAKTKKLKETNKLSLMDEGFKDHLQRIFKRIQTDARIERFEDNVDGGDKKFLTTMKDQLKEFDSEYSWENVARRIKSKVNTDFEKAHGAYDKETHGARNVYPNGLNEGHPLSRQIDDICKESHQNAITHIVKCYGEAYLTNITQAVTGFEAEKYFAGKASGRTADNVVKLNNCLRDLYAHTKEQIKQFAKESSELGGSSKELDTVLSQQLAQLKTAIDEKTLANDMTAFDVLKEQIDKLPKLQSAQVKKSRWQRFIHKSSINISNEQAEGLLKLSKQLKEDKTKILNQGRLGGEGVPTALSNKINTVKDAILDKLPKKMSFSEKLREGFKEAFKPSWSRILGGGTMAAGLTAGVVAPFVVTALTPFAPIIISVLVVGVAVTKAIWVGKNVHEHVKKLNQREAATDQIRENCSSVEGS